MEKDKIVNQAPDEAGEIVLDPELVDRFDRAFTFFLDKLGKTATKDAWKPNSELKVYLYGPKGKDSPYSPSIYHESLGSYVRKSHLENPPDLKRFNRSKTGLVEIEELIEQTNQPG